MAKMFVQEGINEEKLLMKKIEKKIHDSLFICASKKSEKNAKPGITKEEFSKNAIASYDSIRDMIDRRTKIKTAIIKSNAVTKINIDGEKMTVAEAIDKKNNVVDLLLMLNARLSEQYITSSRQMETKNGNMEEAIERLYMNVSGNKDNKNKEDGEAYKNIAKSYIELNEYGLVDPLNLKSKIEELADYLETFTSKVDAVLQMSNCSTIIEIED